MSGAAMSGAAMSSAAMSSAATQDGYYDNNIEVLSILFKKIKIKVLLIGIIINNTSK